MATTVLAAAVFVFLVAEMLPVGLMPQIAADLGSTPAEVGGLIGWYALVAGLSGLPVAAACRRLPRRTVVTAALIVLALGQIAVAVAPNLTTAVAARSAIAVTHVTLWSVAPLMAAELAPAAQRSRAAGRVFLGSSLAMLAGIPAVTFLGQSFGWRTSALVVAALGALLAACVPLFVPRPSPTGTGDRGDEGTRRGTSARALIGVIAPTLLLVTGINVVYPYLSQYAAANGVAEGGFSLLLAAFGAVGVVGVWAVTLRIDAHPGRVSAVIVALAGLLPLGALGPPALFVPAIVLWGLPVAAAPVILQTIVLRLGGVDASVLSAAYVIAFQAGIVAGTRLGGAGLSLGAVPALLCLGLAGLTLPFILSTTRPQPRPMTV